MMIDPTSLRGGFGQLLSPEELSEIKKRQSSVLTATMTARAVDLAPYFSTLQQTVHTQQAPTPPGVAPMPQTAAITAPAGPGGSLWAPEWWPGSPDSFWMWAAAAAVLVFLMIKKR